MIRNKAIARERVTAEEWRKANETAHIMLPTRDSKWNAVLERAVHNNFMYGALDASRALGGLIKSTSTHPGEVSPWEGAPGRLGRYA